MSQYLEDLLSRKKNSLQQDNTTRFYHLAQIKKRIPMPKTPYQTIHIAGSKGKGSTAFYTSSILCKLQHNTLLFTSPHLIDIRERFLHNHQLISRDVWDNSLLWLESQEKSLQLRLSFFDAMTILCFYLASQLAIDVLILETGLGGRWDATNICDPSVIVITPIELEHTEILGNTISAIAQEKAGIMKHHIPIFMSNQHPEAEAVIRQKASDCHAQLYSYQEYITITQNNLIKDNSLSFRYKNEEHQITLPTPLITLAENAILSLMILDYLYPNHQITSLGKEVLANCYFPGRYQKLQLKTTSIILDGSHTVESLRKTSETFSKQYNDKERILIFGCAQDKNFIAMQQFFEAFHTIYFVNIQYSQNQMDMHAKTMQIPYYHDLSLLLSELDNQSNHDKVILLTGSLYLVAEALSFYRESPCFFVDNG
ncbi:cyanophycin synthetase [Entomospira entomophila]|uniref:Dihydrofolate synthase/folylpolyglutamate synthase n=1 Tax=Entomospira entomophila TaxID=2719988 RepID=A0A968GEP4_9SPIO|nr:cyanophycin synthetase [Entomospira entomophilus]NIZ41074.1 hypothetical protein [Entomospira entomophilus]WDI35283.1 cyanophycin synthetase [Entomospira entomophilus]